MAKKPKSDEVKEKELAFYSAVVDAHIQTSLERDRSLLSLSVAAIGVLVTLLTTVGVQSSIVLILYVLSFISFTVTIILILRVLNLNKDYLSKLAKDQPADDSTLKKYDRAIYYFFIAGVLISFGIGLTTALIKQNKKEGVTMATEETGKDTNEQHIAGSVSGLSEMNPKGELMIKSFQGLGNLKPSANNTPAQPAKDTSSDSTSATSTSSSSTSSSTSASGTSDKK